MSHSQSHCWDFKQTAVTHILNALWNITKLVGRSTYRTPLYTTHLYVLSRANHMQLSHDCWHSTTKNVLQCPQTLFPLFGGGVWEWDYKHRWFIAGLHHYTFSLRMICRGVPPHLLLSLLLLFVYVYPYHPYFFNLFSCFLYTHIYIIWYVSHIPRICCSNLACTCSRFF